MKLYHPGQNQTIVTTENQEFYFSYNTCVAVHNEKGNFRIEPISKTTARHMANMGIKDWPVVTEEELNTYLPKILPPLSTKCCVVEQEGVVLPNDDIPTNVAFKIQEIIDEMDFDARCQRIIASLTPRQQVLLAEKLATVK